jgi:hypothetical protein
VVLGERPIKSPSLENYPLSDASVKKVAEQLWDGNFETIQDKGELILVKNIGKGKVVKGPYHASSFSSLGIEKDLVVTGTTGQHAADIAWTHRATNDADIYFIANQEEKERIINLSFRVSGKVPVLYDAVTGTSRAVQAWENKQGRTSFNLRLHKQESVFVVFESPESSSQQVLGDGQNSINTTVEQTITSPWKVQFDRDYKGPAKKVVFKELKDWSQSTDNSIKYYSGTADYKTTFKWKRKNENQRVWLDIGEVANIAEVTVNGINCGVIWTAPYRIDITDALKKGKNKLNIAVTNTWANRMVGDHSLPEAERLIKTTAPYRLEGDLLKAGLLGPVTIVMKSTGTN